MSIPQIHSHKIHAVNFLTYYIIFLTGKLVSKISELENRKISEINKNYRIFVKCSM